MWLWPLRVLSRVVLARVMSGPTNTITVFKFNLVHDSSGSFFLDLVFWLFEHVQVGANRLMGDLDVETSEEICDSRRIVREDNQAVMIGLIHFLLSSQLVAIRNKIRKVVFFLTARA